MTSNERDRLRPTRADHDDVPLSWKLAACAVILFLVTVVAVVLTIPFSCTLNHWPEPVCRMLSSTTTQAQTEGIACAGE